MEIITAEHSGFCFGVKRAIDSAVQIAKEAGRDVYTYGPLIHNEAAIRNLNEAGVFAVEPEQIKSDASDDTIIIRAHGIGKSEFERLKDVYSEVFDATCPFVKKIHRIVEEHSKNGEQIVIVGCKEHPEVVGIRGWVSGDSYVISNEEEAKNLKLDKMRPVCVVSQTTFRNNKFQYYVEILKQKGYDIRAFNTICNATEERQSESSDIAGKVDVMLVIGGENSSNSKKLFEICKDICPRTYFLQSADDLDVSTLQPCERIGITAGASTPHYIIEEVQKKCQK